MSETVPQALSLEAPPECCHLSIELRPASFALVYALDHQIVPVPRGGGHYQMVSVPVTGTWYICPTGRRRFSGYSFYPSLLTLGMERRQFS